LAASLGLNIIFGWKRVKVTNTLAFYVKELISTVKMVKVRLSGPMLQNFLRLHVMNFCNKLECLLLASPPPSLMFVGGTGAYPIEEPFKCFTLG
jgi:hypothetical protein